MPGAVLRITRALVVVGVLALATVGCGGSGQSGASNKNASIGTTSAASTTTVAVSGTKGPGTPLFAGLAVQSGSRLVGTPYPIFSRDGQSFSQGALVIVDGEPARVFADYVQAVEGLGYAFGMTSCDGRGPAQVVTCTIRTDPATAASGSASLTLVAPVATKRDFATSILIELTSLSSKPPLGSNASIGASSAVDTARVRSIQATSIPERGDPIAPPGVDQAQPITVVGGVEMILPAVPIVPSSKAVSGWTAIARVTGDPKQIRDEMLGQGTWASTEQSEMSVGGSTILRGVATDDAGTLDVTLFSVATGARADTTGWFLVLTRSLA